MLFFTNDYGYGAHPEVLKALCDTNGEPLPGYGEDAYSARAKEKIRAFLQCPGAQIVFLAGGTQVNVNVLDMLLEPYEAVISADSGHIYVHEAGAVEATGHKVTALPNENGKLTAQRLTAYLKKFYGDEAWEHCPIPGAVYISFPTETGTLYTLRELTDLRDACDAYELKLYIDGARMAYGLGCPENDVPPHALAELADAFTLGGTKCGTLCGEAAVFPREKTAHLVNRIKRRGALLAKGRLTGVQFDALFTNDLYMRIGRDTARMTEKLRTILMRKGYRFAFDSPTNQQFILVPEETLRLIRNDIAFALWEKRQDGLCAIRLCTSFATTEGDLEALAARLPDADYDAD